MERDPLTVERHGPAPHIFQTDVLVHDNCSSRGASSVLGRHEQGIANNALRFIRMQVEGFLLHQVNIRLAAKLRFGVGVAAKFE